MARQRSPETSSKASPTPSPHPNDLLALQAQMLARLLDRLDHAQRALHHPALRSSARSHLTDWAALLRALPDQATISPSRRRRILHRGSRYAEQATRRLRRHLVFSHPPHPAEPSHIQMRELTAILLAYSARIRESIHHAKQRAAHRRRSACHPLRHANR